jgi:hypothetical protein
MPRKRRVKESPAPEVAATEPTPVAEVLANSPMAQLLASREAEAWLKPNHDGAFDETQDLARAFAQQRREEAQRAR